MEQNFKNIIEIVKESIIADLNQNVNIDIVLKAYNAYEKDEHDDVDRIYNIDNSDDFLTLVNDHNFSARDMYSLMDELKRSPELYFLYNPFESKCKVIYSLSELKSILIDSLDRVLPYVIRYVARCEGYKEIYETYIAYPLELHCFGN